MYVAMEYCKNGDLRTYLRKTRKAKNNLYANAKVISPVQKSVLLKLSLDVASGMAHLAERQVRNNIKPSCKSLITNPNFENNYR